MNRALKTFRPSSRWLPTSKLTPSLSIIICGLFFSLTTYCNAQDSPAGTSAQKGWISEFKKPENTKESDITPQLKKLLAPPKLFERHKRAYPSLRFYYKRAIRAFTALYPAGLFPKPSIETGLQEYEGKLSLTSYDVFFVPFAPIVPEVSLNLNDLQFFKTATRVDSKTIYGLTLKSSLPSESPSISRNVNVIYRLTMAYIATVNARILGFSHAQLIPELSRGITSANQFEYNGLRPWSEHSRYKQEDQLQGPIRLTNYAHQAGSQLNISSHPDFALTARFIERNGVLMTFFLWLPEAKVLGFNVPIQPTGPPDFVFRIDLKRTTTR
jgi:hypothetical protein